MDSLNNVIVSSQARLQTSSINIVGRSGIFTLTADNQLVFTANGKNNSNNFILTLSDIRLADFRDALSGKVDIVTKSGKAYRIKFISKRSPFQFLKGTNAVDSTNTVKQAFEWEKHFKSMLDPSVIAGSDLHDPAKRISMGLTTLILLVVAAIFVAFFIGSSHH